MMRADVQCVNGSYAWDKPRAPDPVYYLRWIDYCNRSGIYATFGTASDGVIYGVDNGWAYDPHNDMFYPIPPGFNPYAPYRSHTGWS